jgi:hypothetical protein
MTVDWAAICDAAYFDRFNRLCMFGVETAGPRRTVPVGVHRLAMVIHFDHRNPHDDPEVAVFVTSPDGEWRAADGIRDFCVDSRGDYLIVHMPGVSLQKEGVYRFELACGSRESTMCELSLVVHSQPPPRVCSRGAH